MRVILELGDDRIPLYFGMVAFEEMQKLVSSYLGTNKYVVDVVWSGYLNQCAVDSVHPEMTYNHIMEKLEDYFFDPDGIKSNIKSVLDAFDKSKAGSKLFNDVDRALEVIDQTKNDIKDSVKKKTKLIKRVKKPVTMSLKK